MILVAILGYLKKRRDEKEMGKSSLKENGKNENICFKIYICKKSITYFVPQMMAAGTGMAGDVAAMAASASVHSQPMAPGDMQV